MTDDAWTEATRDVTPLKKRDTISARKSRAPAKPRAHGDIPITPNSRAIDKGLLIQLKKGQIRPQAKLDLHGMSQAEAHAALLSFLHRAAKAKKRCVLVITGKGERSAKHGVLRRALPHWLEAHDIAPLIQACEPAAKQDGGHGAYYVYLAKA